MEPRVHDAEQRALNETIPKPPQRLASLRNRSNRHDSLFHGAYKSHRQRLIAYDSVRTSDPHCPRSSSHLIAPVPYVVYLFS